MAEHNLNMYMNMYMVKMYMVFEPCTLTIEVYMEVYMVTMYIVHGECTW